MTLNDNNTINFNIAIIKSCSKKVKYINFFGPKRSEAPRTQSKSHHSLPQGNQPPYLIILYNPEKGCTEA